MTAVKYLVNGAIMVPYSLVVECDDESEEYQEIRREIAEELTENDFLGYSLDEAAFSAYIEQLVFEGAVDRKGARTVIIDAFDACTGPLEVIVQTCQEVKVEEKADKDGVGKVLKFRLRKPKRKKAK